MSANVIGVTEATFQADVLQRSLDVPVAIGFWADWCQPCHMLSPILQRAVAAREGDVGLGKVDVDANPRLAQAFQVQGIPASRRSPAAAWSALGPHGDRPSGVARGATGHEIARTAGRRMLRCRTSSSGTQPGWSSSLSTA